MYDTLTKDEVFARYTNIIPLRYSDVFHLVMGHSPSAVVNDGDGGHVWVYGAGRNAVTLGDTPFGTISPFPSTVDFYEDLAMEDWSQTRCDNKKHLLGFVRAVLLEEKRGKTLNLVGRFRSKQAA